MNAVLAVHVATDAIRNALAHIHFENVAEGDDEVVAHLNAASDEHCQELFALALTLPDLDVWALERLLEDLPAEADRTRTQPVSRG